MPSKNYIILFEYDKPESLPGIINKIAGIWKWKIALPGLLDITGGVISLVDNTDFVSVQVKSVRVDGVFYSQVSSLSDCLSTDSSFYYDASTFEINIHFADFEPPLAKDISYGAIVGFTFNAKDRPPLFNGSYFANALASVPTFKKSVDPQYYGKLKYQSATAELLHDGELDDWRDRDLYGQPGRYLYGEQDDDYVDFNLIYSGYISNDSRTWQSLKVDISDPRKGLEQPVASNILTSTDYPNISEDNENVVKPVRYGILKNAKAICLDENAPGATEHVFLIADTEFNAVDSITTVYVDGTAVTPNSTDLAAGTVTLAAGDVGDNFDAVTLDFQATDITNGVEIIKDLMANYDGKTYISSFWDLTEVGAAGLLSLDTSLNIEDGSKKLSEALESVATDISARFFVKDNGLYTIRIYDENRTPVKRLYDDDWLDTPEITNNGSEFLTSAIIKYNKDQENDTWLTYEETSYRAAAFAKYRRYKVETYETGLNTEADAKSKAEKILDISSNVTDIITRTTTLEHLDLDVTDFIYADPDKRLTDNYTWGIYEVLGIDKDLTGGTIKLEMRYVKAGVDPAEYDILVDESGNFYTDESGSTLIAERV